MSRSPVAIVDLLSTAAAVAPEEPALSTGGVTYSYAEVLDVVGKAADGLAGTGVRPGERVCVFLEKRLETVAALFGASMIGAAFVPINPALKPRQVAHIVRDSGATTLITGRERWQGLRQEFRRSDLRTRILLLDGPIDPADDGDVVLEWGAVESASEPRRNALDNDLAAILYTSGSTGAPKGVALSNRNLVAGACSVSEYLGNSDSDVLLAVLPLSFDAGLSQLTTGFAARAHVVLVNYLLPRDVPRACARYGITGITAVPPLWMQLSELDWSEAGRSIRYFANTGGRLPRPTLNRLREAFPGAAPFLMYGLTEAFRSTYLDPSQVVARPDSIGKAIPNAEIVVCRPDGTECDPGEPGELVHRGPLVALGYWNDPVRTAERFRRLAPREGDDSGWRAEERVVWSGDVVVRDGEGFLSFVGRTDDMIKRSGHRISPTEIEEVVLQIEGVREAVALGIAEAGIGHRIVLLVTVEGDAVDEWEAVRKGCRVELPSFMVPDRVVIVDSIPRNSNGKYDRALLKEAYS